MKKILVSMGDKITGVDRVLWLTAYTPKLKEMLYFTYKVVKIKPTPQFLFTKPLNEPRFKIPRSPNFT